MSTLEKLIFLSGTLWLSAIGFIAYAWIMQARQNKMLCYIAKRLNTIEKLIQPTRQSQTETVVRTPTQPSRSKQTTSPETSISIDKSEPLSKYETVTLPDEININFVDR